MKIDPSAINSPLALIALFVAIIELFLIFPIAKLTGKDRTMLVVFVIAYPVFIAGFFFYFLWHKPVNLYTPQTLSENLQQALLPDRLLAPDRAAVTAIELKITTLEGQVRDMSRRAQSSAGLAETPEIVKKSDLEALKAELLTRAQAAGDFSRTGIASAAREIKTEEVATLKGRAAAAQNQLSRFRTWIEAKGLVVLPPVQTVDAVENSDGPFLSADSISLGSQSTDSLVPGLYIHRVADQQKFELSITDATLQLLWTTADYMASRFMGNAFPNPGSILQRANANSSKGYLLTYGLFTELAEKFGDAAFEAALVNMLNDWNSKSTLESSFASIAAGLSKSVPDTKLITNTFQKFRARIPLPKGKK